MPLRDHFRPPLDLITSWEGFHGQWPAVIVQQLRKQLPAGYVAEPRVHSGSQVEIDVAAFEKDDAPPLSRMTEGNGGVPTAVWAPARAQRGRGNDVARLRRVRGPDLRCEARAAPGRGHRDRQSGEQGSTGTSQCLCRQVCGAAPERRGGQHRRSGDRQALQPLLSNCWP